MTLTVVGEGSDAAEIVSWVRSADPDAALEVVSPAGVRGTPRRYVLAVADPVRRWELAEQLDRAGWRAFTVIHPAATVGDDVELAPGAVVGPGCRITTNVRCGPHLRLEPGATISHDCRLGVAVTVGTLANVAGTCSLGDGVRIGARAALRQGISLGPGAVVEPGAVVVADVARSTRVAGVPARLSEPRSTWPADGGR